MKLSMTVTAGVFVAPQVITLQLCFCVCFCVCVLREESFQTDTSWKLSYKSRHS